MPLEERLELAIDDALSNVDRVGTALDDAAGNFKVALAEALDVLKSAPTVDISADASSVTTDVNTAVQAADTTITPEAQTGGLTTQIDDAVAGTSATFTPEANTDAVGTQIDDAVSSTTATVPISADTSNLGTQIDDAVSAITPPEVPLEADTSQIDSALTDSSTKAEGLAKSASDAGDSLGAVGSSAALATGELGAAQDVISKITPEMAGAAGATAGLALAGKDLFNAALQQDTALARLREEFGPLADAIEHVNVGGLNESLDHLAVRTGADIAGLQNFAASFGELGKSAGDSTPHIADVATQINALAVRASVLNPNLGTADEIVQRLSTSLARGGRTLAAYGISLSTAQIDAEALRETGKATTADLNVYDKTVAGAALATQQLGGALATDINNGAQKAQVQLRALKAAFAETLTSAGRPLIQPTIDAFKDLEPILAQLSQILGTGLAGALHVVGPLLSVIATVLQAIPAPVLLAVGAFAAFQRILGALTFTGVLEFLTVLPAKAAAAGLSFLGLGAEAETAAVEVEGAAAQTTVAAGEMEAATVAGAGGAGLLGGALAALNPLTLALTVATVGLVEVVNDHTKARDREKQSLQAADDALKSYSGNIGEAIQKTVLVKNTLDNFGISSRKFASDLTTAGISQQDFFDALGGDKGAIDRVFTQLNALASQEGATGDAATELTAVYEELTTALEQSAHARLIAAVAGGELSRADELVAIKAHTAKDGHVDWIGVLNDLKPALDKAGTATDDYGNKLDVATQAAKNNANAQQSVAAATLAGLAGTEGITNDQVQVAIALNTGADGAVNYAAALKSIDPAAAAVAADTATIASGLDDVHTRFQLAKDQAALYKEQFDELVQPMLNFEQARTAFTDAVDATGKAFDINKDKADAYKQSVSEIVDPVLNVQDANIKLFAAIDKTNTTLAANKGATDLKTQAGRDSQQAVLDLVKAYNDEIDAEQRAGDSAAVINQTRQDELTHVQALANQYPGLKTQVGELETALRTANTTSDTANTLLETHQKELETILTDGSNWIQALIAMGANEADVAAARQTEIDKLEALKQKFPELAPVIQGYIDKLGGIPPQKDTVIQLHNVEESEAQLANIHTAIDELHDKRIEITANTIDAQIGFDELTRRINDGTFAAQTFEQQIALVNRAFANSPFATNFASQPGEPGFGRMSGGPIWPGVWTVGEAGPETLFVNQTGTGFVVPNSGTSTTATAGGLSGSDLDRLVSTVVAAVQSQRPITVISQREDPEVTAVKVSSRLGRWVNV